MRKISSSILIKRISLLFFALFALFISQTVISAGLLFNVSATGTPAKLSITLCLNANGPLSCQNYSVSALDLSINTTIPNHVYPAAGIKINTPGYAVAGCTPIANGYCLFSANNTTPTNIAVSSTSAFSVGGAVSGLSGTVVLQNNGGGSQTVSSNGSFTFSTPVTAGEPYSVTVLTQPASQTCTVSNGSGIMGSTDVTNVVVSCAPNTTTLSASVSTLALSVNNHGLNAALTGNPRQITITNTGAADAENVSYNATTLPVGTTISPASCGTIAPSGTCVLTITPGANPSATPYNLSPTPITLTIAGDNTNTLSPTANILTYGSVYEGGYVYAIDDLYADYPEGVSVGGKAVTLQDQAEPYIGTGPQATSTVWASNGAGISDVSYDIIPLIAESHVGDSYDAAQTIFNATYSNSTTYPFPSSSYFSTCSGATDGACNSHNILALYNAYITHYGIGGFPYTLSPGPTPLTDYPAGLCTATISGYSDWYFPAICEMDSVDGGLACPGGTQSMVGSLPALLGDPGATTPNTSCSNGVNCLTGFYWSSTEVAGSSRLGAWNEGFVIGGSSQYSTTKDTQLGVRCSRALTP